ncbi:hypothetical protein NX059_011739 [Plenodomus lindquistii]|nr:hypothetical protein NX059_011739 [Plenodomus lindquistii]
MRESQDWSLTNGHGYILNRDRSHAAASRLNVQFYLWKAALGYNIHPSIPPHLPPAPAIAEVASGTGLWAIDVSAEFPKAHIEALDYNLEQSPPQA